MFFDNKNGNLMTYFSPEENFLIKLLFREEKLLLDTAIIDEKALLSIAVKNGLAQLLYINDGSKQLSKEAQKQLKDNYLYNLGKNAGIQLIVAQIIEKLSQKEIPVILLKGISLITNVYDDIALRPMSDLDILLPIKSVFEAWKLLNPKEIELKLNDIKTIHHLPLFNYKGISVELHRFLFPSDVKYQIPIDEIWQSAIELPDFNASSINPTYQIIYQLLHIYYSCRQGGLRLSWFYDIKELLSKFDNEITLETVENQAKIWKIEKPIRKMLTFFTVLSPKTTLSVSISKKETKEIKKMINLLHISDRNKKTEYGYGIALERLANTKGIKNKIIFIINTITDNGKGKRKFSIKRIYDLSKNFIGHIFCKFV
ncbi:MAG: nucleotidyltransferase family protein [Marinilabiliaceae bacterium]|nr:nucleotidyltransferase family protein [Marinilabiliaceae bacterium]